MKKETSRKDKVMQTALKLVAAGGFQASAMADLSKQSGVAIGTIYHHFESKEALIEALFNQVSEGYIKAVGLAIDPSLSMSKRFDAMWNTTLAHFGKNPNDFAFIEQYQNSPSMKGKLFGGKTSDHKKVADYFKDGLKEGKFRKLTADQLTVVFFGLAALAIQMNTGKKKLTPKELEIMRDMAWSALKK